MSSPHRRRWGNGQPPARQRGIAMLVAILLVALGTIVAATVAYENAMVARKGTGDFAFDQSVLAAEAAETFAAWGLREIRKADSKEIYIGQGWDKPQGPFELVPDVMVTVSMEDMEGRFNLNSLVNAQGAPDPTAVAAFQHLLVLVGIEPTWVGYVIDWIDPDIVPTNPDGAEDSVYLGQTPPYRTPNMYITSASELLALPGFGHDRYQKLAPYVTALPSDAKINVCTASGVVLDAYLPAGRQEFSLDPEGLQKNRLAAGGCFPTLNDYRAAGGGTAQATAPQTTTPTTTGTPPGNPAGGGSTVGFDTRSSYFKLTTYITMGTTEFNLYSLMVQDQNTGNSRAILRSFTPD